MKKYLFLGGIILGLGLLINYSLGGFAEIEPELVEVNDYIIYGTGFEGSYKSNQLNEMVDEMRNYQQRLDLNTDLVIINYINEAQETVGIVNNFVGLRLGLSTQKKDLVAFEKRIIRASRAIRIKVKIKPLVMPSPEKINKTAFEFAASKGIELQNLSIEQYKENGVLVVEFPVVEEK